MSSAERLQKHTLLLREWETEMWQRRALLLQQFEAKLQLLIDANENEAVGVVREQMKAYHSSIKRWMLRGEYEEVHRLETRSGCTSSLAKLARRLCAQK